MSSPQIKTRVQIREERLGIVSDLYKKGYSIRQIRKDVIKKMELSSCSTQTIHSDIKLLLNEWRKYRLDNVDDVIQLELERIDNIISALWEQWDKTQDVRYITELRNNLIERRKILGVYAPEKKDVTADLVTNISITQMDTPISEFASSENEVKR